jgi:hypothetical protein
MKKNNTVETAQKGQATNKNTQPENVKNDLKKIQEHREAKKSNVPTGKVTLLKETEARKKARKEQYDNFRINSLKRKCKNRGLSEEDISKYVEKLKEQLNSPHSYHILIMFDKKEVDMVKQAIKNEGLEYKVMADSYVMLDGDSEVLDTVRGIMPPSAKIHPYAKKFESVLPAEKKEVIKKPSNNTAEAKANAKQAKRGKGLHGSKRWLHRLQKGRTKDTEGKPKKFRVHSSEFFLRNGKPAKRRKPSPRPNAGVNPTRVHIGKRAWKKASSTQAVLSLAERISKQKAIAIQLKAKKGSTDSKKASTTAKKAA